MAEGIAYKLVKKDKVATIRMVKRTAVVDGGAKVDIHWALGEALEKLRWDDSVRIIVLTGDQDGEFLSTPAADHYGTESQKKRMKDMFTSWSMMNGAVRTHQALALMEKPVIARLNGDAIGFGQSVLFGCDIIVAREDARVSDVHMSMGKVEQSDGVLVGPPWGLVPGDGAMSWVPMAMPPQKAKEYLMLSRVFTAKELAAMNIVNYAVKLEELDAVTDRIIEELLARPAVALAWTKRLLNKHLMNHVNLVTDASSAYEKLNLYQIAENGGKDRFDL